MILFLWTLIDYVLCFLSFFFFIFCTLFSKLQPLGIEVLDSDERLIEDRFFPKSFILAARTRVCYVCGKSLNDLPTSPCANKQELACDCALMMRSMCAYTSNNHGNTVIMILDKLVGNLESHAWSSYWNLLILFLQIRYLPLSCLRHAYLFTFWCSNPICGACGLASVHAVAYASSKLCLSTGVLFTSYINKMKNENKESIMEQWKWSETHAIYTLWVCCRLH